MAYTRKAKRVFGRERDQKCALMRSLARALILNERIKTTEAKAKSLRPFVERLVTKSRENSLSRIRHLNVVLGNDNTVVSKLMKNIAPRYIDRNGGYTRIIKLHAANGSGRTEAIIEFV